MNLKTRSIIYILLCLLVTLLQTATHVFQHYGLTFLLTCFLYFIFGLLIQSLFRKIDVGIIYLAIIPYLLLLAGTGFYQEDFPDGVGMMVSLSLAIWIKKAKATYPVKMAGIFLWLSGVFYFSYFIIPNREILNYSSEKNTPLPNFTLINKSGEKLMTAQWKGKVVLIEMWYTKCGACIKQINATQKVQGHFKNNPEILFSAVNCGYDAMTDIKEFSTRKPFIKNIYLDQDTSIAKYLKFNAFPKVLILDKAGKLRFQVDGFSEEWKTEYQEKVITIIETLAKE